MPQLCVSCTFGLLTSVVALDFTTVDFISCHTDAEITIIWSDGQQEGIPVDKLDNLSISVVEYYEYDFLSLIRVIFEGGGAPSEPNRHQTLREDRVSDPLT